MHNSMHTHTHTHAGANSYMREHTYARYTCASICMLREHRPHLDELSGSDSSRKVKDSDGTSEARGHRDGQYRHAVYVSAQDECELVAGSRGQEVGRRARRITGVRRKSPVRMRADRRFAGMLAFPPASARSCGTPVPHTQIPCPTIRSFPWGECTPCRVRAREERQET